VTHHSGFVMLFVVIHVNRANNNSKQLSQA
jgi:hypothetical protein